MMLGGTGANPRADSPAGPRTGSRTDSRTEPRTEPRRFLRGLYDRAVQRALPAHNLAAW